MAAAAAAAPVSTAAPLEKNGDLPDIEFYHGDCPDGESCHLLTEDHARLIDKTHKIEFRPWYHGVPPGHELAPNFKGMEGKKVSVRDVCPSIEELKSHFAKTRWTRICDHHSNAFTEKVAAFLLAEKATLPHVTIKLDTSKIVCAAQMTWKEYMGDDTPMPVWLDAINRGDTDLCKNRSDDQKAYHTYIAQPEHVQSLNLLRQAITVDEKTAILKGREILAARHKQNVAALKKGEIKLGESLRDEKGGRWDVLYLNAPLGPEYISQLVDLVDVAIKDASLPKIDIAVVRWTHARTKVPQLSLRSLKDMVDVSIIAARYGGGGHKKASGVQTKSQYLE